ncbi:MAG: peptidylprolyl isomerase [Methanocellales archaeon]
MAQAKNGDTVIVHYTGKLDDGTIFDTSTSREPLQFTIGEEQLIPSFEKAVIGMTEGETKTIKIPASEAYGPYREELILTIERNKFPLYFQPRKGQRLQIRQANGSIALVYVVEVTESTITLDANHPLAGKDLTFDIQLLKIL